MRLGIEEENSVHAGGPLKWRVGAEPFETVELTPESEAAFVESETAAGLELEKRKGRKREAWAMVREAGRLLPRESVHFCSRYKHGGAPVSVWQSRKGGSFYGNLQRCTSIWTCFICAGKITEKRRADLQEGLNFFRSQAGRIYLLTLTVPHDRDTRTRELCDQFLKAYQQLQNSRTWRGWKKDVGLMGTIRGIEVTYGANGPHVHAHVLLFCSAEGSEPFRQDLLWAWKSACASVGLGEPNERGVDIRSGEYAASYVSKWGLECEMTKAHIKRGNAGGRTPWDLLRDSLKGDEAAGRLFQEFAHAFKGRRQLWWSRGLRSLLGLKPERSEEELVKDDTDNAELVCTISADDWARVLEWDVRAEVLIIAEREGAEGVAMFLHRLERFKTDEARRLYVARRVS